MDSTGRFAAKNALPIHPNQVDGLLAKLRHLRQRVQRFTQLRKALQPLFSNNLEKVLTFLDDRLLPATLNAVERGNRRYRKMQKTIYRVRTQAHILGRMALDMLRDSFAQVHRATLQLLHQARAGPALHPVMVLQCRIKTL